MVITERDLHGGKKSYPMLIYTFYFIVLCIAVLNYSVVKRLSPQSCPHPNPQTCDILPNMAEGTRQM